MEKRNFKDLFINYIEMLKRLRQKDNKDNCDIDTEKARTVLLELAKDLSNIKDYIPLILKNPWVDIFLDIIKMHPEYFYQYFNDKKNKKSFSDYIRDAFLAYMVQYNTTQELILLNNTDYDYVLKDGDYKPTQFLFAKRFYLGIKEIHPILAKNIYDEVIDRYQIKIFNSGYSIINSYSEFFETMKTTHGKCALISEVINKIKIDGYKIDTSPVLNDDLLMIFESCLKSRDYILINFAGGYIEYLINISRDKKTKEFKDKVIKLFEKYDNFLEVSEFWRNMYYE